MNKAEEYRKEFEKERNKDKSEKDKIYVTSELVDSSCVEYCQADEHVEYMKWLEKKLSYSDQENKELIERLKNTNKDLWENKIPFLNHTNEETQKQRKIGARLVLEYLYEEHLNKKQ